MNSGGCSYKFHKMMCVLSCQSMTLMMQDPIWYFFPTHDEGRRETRLESKANALQVYTTRPKQ